MGYKRRREEEHVRGWKRIKKREVGRCPSPPPIGGQDTKRPPNG